MTERLQDMQARLRELIEADITMRECNQGARKQGQRAPFSAAERGSLKQDMAHLRRRIAQEIRMQAIRDEVEQGATQ